VLTVKKAVAGRKILVAEFFASPECTVEEFLGAKRCQHGENLWRAKIYIQELFKNGT